MIKFKETISLIAVPFTLTEYKFDYYHKIALTFSS